MDGPCHFLTIEFLVFLNAKMLQMANQSGNFLGEDNLRERPALEGILDALQYPSFGVDRYPTVIDKASALGWYINAVHVFWEGNKRTGMAACRHFLQINGYDMDMNRDEIIRMGFAVANHEVDLEAFTLWVAARTFPIETGE